MEDMPERHRLPNKEMIKVPAVYSLYCQSSYREGERGEERRWRRGGRGKGERREGEEGGRGRGEKGRKREGGEEERRGGGGGGGTYAVLSQCPSVFAVM